MYMDVMASVVKEWWRPSQTVREREKALWTSRANNLLAKTQA